MDSYQEINGVLQRYFDGLYHADADLLASVFHIDAHYSCAVDKELIHLSMEEYFANVRQRQSPASLKLPRNDRVLAIDIVGQHTAMAKVQCVLAPRYFTDFLSLVKVQGQWLIISKVFDYQLTPFT